MVYCRSGQAVEQLSRGLPALQQDDGWRDHELDDLEEHTVRAEMHAVREEMQ